MEREIRGKPPNDRCEIRQARSRPLVEDLHRWFNKTLAEHDLSNLARKLEAANALAQ